MSHIFWQGPCTVTAPGPGQGHRPPGAQAPGHRPPGAQAEREDPAGVTVTVTAASIQQVAYTVAAMA